MLDRNWLDIGIWVVIAGYFLIGLSSGFIFSAYRLICLAISLSLSLMFYDRLAGFVHGTFIEEVLEMLIYSGLRLNQPINSAQMLKDMTGVMDGISGVLRLPTNVEDYLLRPPQNLDIIPRTSLFGDRDYIFYFSDELAKSIINVLCVIALYVVIRIILAILKIFLDEVASMKAFRVCNYILGPAFGVVEAFSVIYFSLAIIMLLNVVVQQDIVFEYLERSTLAKRLYEENFLLDFILQNMHSTT